MEGSCLSDWNEDHGDLQPPPPGGGTPYYGLYGKPLP